MELSAAPESLQESVSTTHASAQDDTEDVLLSELPGLPGNRRFDVDLT